MNVRFALMKTVNYMKTYFPYDDQFFKHLEVFLPQKPESNNMHSITRIALYLNFNDKMIDSIREEWKLFIFDSDTYTKLSEYQKL